MEDTECCGSMPCDDPEENNGNKCGCPTGYYWDEDFEDCFVSGASCGVPPSNCDTDPYQVACLDTYIPWDPIRGCCYFDTYGGVPDYTWNSITTY